MIEALGAEAPERRFVCTPSGDLAKADLELRCTECNELVCDIEPDDNLGILVDVAREHANECTGESPDDD